MDWSITLPDKSYIYNLILSIGESVEELCNNAKLAPKLTSELDCKVVYYRGVVLQNLPFEFYKNTENEEYQVRYPFYLTQPVGLTAFSFNYHFDQYKNIYKETDKAAPDCIAVFYEDFKGGNAIKINDTIHVVGVCEHQNPPLMHVFAYKIAHFNILAELSFARTDYRELVNFVRGYIGDELLAEYVILILGNSSRAETPLSLLVSRAKGMLDNSLLGALEYLAECVKYVSDYSGPLYSSMDYEKSPETVVAGQLQLAKGTAVVLNLDDLAAKSKESVEILLDGKVEYRFGPSTYRLSAYLRTILTTSSEDISNLPKPNIFIKFKQNPDFLPTQIIPSDYKYLQLIDRAWSSPLQIDIPTDVEEVMIDSWTKLRDDANIEDFNTWVTLCRTYCYLNGDESITVENWYSKMT